MDVDFMEILPLKGIVPFVGKVKPFPQ